MDDIPGFFFDRERNRYFRTTAGQPLPTATLRERVAKAVMEKSPFSSRPRKLWNKSRQKEFNIADALTVRQDGRVTGPSQWQKEVLRFSLERLRLSNSFTILNASDVQMRQLHWIKSLGQGNYVGAWSKRTARQPEFYKVSVCDAVEDEKELENETKFITRIGDLHHHLIMDIQYVELDSNNIFLMYVANSTILRDNVFEIVRCPIQGGDHEDDVENDGSLTYSANFIGKYHLQGALRCCSWNKNKNLFMVGTERGALCRSLYSDFSLVPSFDVDSHCLEFTENGNSVYCGHDNSMLSRIDTRTYSVHRLDEFSSVIASISILSDENKLIVNTFDENLFLYDIRKNKIMHSFRGHVNFGRKLHVSFSENSDILCVGGHDSRIRFWSLSTGEPIASLPSVTGKPSMSFFQETAKRFHAHVFSNEGVYVLQ